MKNPWIFPVATLLVGAVGGYISGKNTSATPAGADASGESGIRVRSSQRGGTAESASGKERRNNRAGDLASISRLPGTSSRIQALMDLYAGLSPEQLEEEALKLENLPMNERMMASVLLFGRWAEVDPTAAMAFSNTMGFAGMFVRPTILSSWASVDPAGAAKYYAANPREFAMMGGGRGPMGGGQNGASIIAAEWAKQDPAAAMAWASGLPQGQSDALNAVVGEVAKSDPKKAAELLASISSEDKGSAYRTIAAQFGSTNFAEAQAWIRTLPADEQASALASAISGLSNTDPQAAARQVAGMESGETKDRAVRSVVADLARVDPQEAASFLKEQGSEESARDGVRDLMPAWVAKDPAAALNFANSLDSGGARDSALQSYIWSNNAAAPAELIKVAETIDDEGDRARTIGMTAMRWMGEDAQAARSYIETSTTIPDDAKERILEGRGMWGGRGGPGGGRGGPGGGR